MIYYEFYQENYIRTEFNYKEKSINFNKKYFRNNISRGKIVPNKFYILKSFSDENYNYFSNDNLKYFVLLIVYGQK